MPCSSGSTPSMRGHVRAHPRRRFRGCATSWSSAAAAPPGMLDGDALVAAASDAEPPRRRRITRSRCSTPRARPDARRARCVGRTRPERPSCHCSSTSATCEDDVYITTGPLYHSGPGGFLQVAHLLGNTAMLQRRFDAEDWLRLVEKYRVSTTFSAPTPIRLVVSLPAEVKTRYDRSSMRRMIANAAPWSYSLKERYLADFPEDSLWEVYGSTELGVDTVLRARRPAAEAGLVRAARPRRGDQAGRRGWRGGHRAGPAGRGVRAQPEQLREPTTRPRRSSRRAGAASSFPSATSRIATRKASTTSVTARAT